MNKLCPSCKHICGAYESGNCATCHNGEWKTKSPVDCNDCRKEAGEFE